MQDKNKGYHNTYKIILKLRGSSLIFYSKKNSYTFQILYLFDEKQNIPTHKMNQVIC